MALQAASSLHAAASALPSSGEPPEFFAPCCTPESDLKRAVLSSLARSERHLDRTIDFQTVSDLEKTEQGIRVSVIDSKDRRGTLLLVTGLPVRRLFLPKGWDITVKAPYITEDGTVELWHLVDLKVRPPPNTSSSWKKSALVAVKREYWAEAVARYNYSLDGAKEAQIPHIKKLRAEAYLNLGFYQLAKEDAEWVVESGHDVEESYLRLAQAWYWTCDYEAALEVLVKNRIDTAEAKLLKKQIKTRLAEEQGEYDFATLREMTKDDPAMRMGCSNFESPLLECRNIEGRGRGMVATDDIEIGSLLLAVKSRFWSPPNPPRHARTGLPLNEEFGIWQQYMQHSPMEHETINLLKTNSYVSPAPGNIVDAVRLDRILSNNVHGASDLHYALCNNTQPVPHSMGLWPLGAMINHSCMPNCTYATIGDLMIVRANTCIPAGTEACLSYISPLTPDRSAKITQRWGFVCDCALCKCESTESSLVVKERQLILSRLTPGISTKRVNALLRTLNDTYKDYPPEIPRLTLGYLQSYLSIRAWAAPEKKAVEMFTFAHISAYRARITTTPLPELHDMGLCPDPLAWTLFMALDTWYMQRADKENWSGTVEESQRLRNIAVAWRNIAYTQYQILAGERGSLMKPCTELVEGLSKIFTKIGGSATNSREVKTTSSAPNITYSTGPNAPATDKRHAEITTSTPNITYSAGHKARVPPQSRLLAKRGYSDPVGEGDAEYSSSSNESISIPNTTHITSSNTPTTRNSISPNSPHSNTRRKWQEADQSDTQRRRHARSDSAGTSRALAYSLTNAVTQFLQSRDGIQPAAAAKNGLNPSDLPQDLGHGLRGLFGTSSTEPSDAGDDTDTTYSYEEGVTLGDASIEEGVTLGDTSIEPVDGSFLSSATTE